MGKNIKYGEFTFPASTARPSARPVSTARSTKGIPKAMYDAPHAMKDGGYAKGGPKVRPKREPEAMVRKEVALLRKSGAPKALISHEVREMSGEMDTPATKKAEVGMMRKAKAPSDHDQRRDDGAYCHEKGRNGWLPMPKAANLLLALAPRWTQGQGWEQDGQEVWHRDPEVRKRRRC
jgi:hypothetical protein